MKLPFNVYFAIAGGLLNCAAWYVAFLTMNIYSYEVDMVRFICSIALLLIGAFLSVYVIRRQLGGYINFREAAKAGILYTIIFSLIVALFSTLYYKVLAPDVIDFFKSDARKAMMEQKYPESDIVKNMEVIDSYFGFFRMLMSNIIFGTLFSLLAAAVLRKKDPAPPISAN
jgi:hypothetical protein